MTLEIQRTEEAELDAARRRAWAEADQGIDPYALWGQAAVDDVFAGHMPDLARCRARAADVHAAKRKADAARAASQRLSRMTDTVLREWDEDERRARRELAETEAKRRLGMET